MRTCRRINQNLPHSAEGMRAAREQVPFRGQEAKHLPRLNDRVTLGPMCDPGGVSWHFAVVVANFLRAAALRHAPKQAGIARARGVPGVHHALALWSLHLYGVAFARRCRTPPRAQPAPACRAEWRRGRGCFLYKFLDRLFEGEQIAS